MKIDLLVIMMGSRILAKPLVHINCPENVWVSVIISMFLSVIQSSSERQGAHVLALCITKCFRGKIF